MTSQTRQLTLLDNMRAVARSAGTSMLARRVQTSAAAVLREIGELLNAGSNMRKQLRQMADECESTQPGQAARLRKLADSHWSE